MIREGQSNMPVLSFVITGIAGAVRLAWARLKGAREDTTAA